MGILGGIKALFARDEAPATPRRPEPPPLPTVPSTWIQRHTLARCHNQDDAQAVAGEGHYQDAIGIFTGGKTETGPAIRLHTAELRPEPNNRHDPNAIAVLIQGHTVGYIPATETDPWHRAIAPIHASGQPATCVARITGGWNRGYGDEGHYGIVLLAKPGQADPNDPTIPPSLARKIAVTGEQHYQDTLAQLLGPQSAQLAGEDGLITVYIAGRRVGQLSKTMAERYTPLIIAIHQAGLPVTCQAIVEHGKKKIEASIYMTNPDYL